MKEAERLVDHRDFSAVLLAGGKSTRMGTDKAALVFQGEPLWERQFRKLKALGAVETIISGPADGPWRKTGTPVLEDENFNCSPMLAIAGILRKTSAQRVVVLAVDLPFMTADYLDALLMSGGSIVPRNGKYFEPLAAVYSKSDLNLMEQMLTSGEHSLQAYLRNATENGTIKIREVRQDESSLFFNLNAPGDLALSPLRSVCKKAGANKDPRKKESDDSVPDNASE